MNVPFHVLVEEYTEAQLALLIMGLSDWDKHKEQVAKRLQKNSPKDNPNRTKVKPPKPFKEMTMEEHMAWMSQAGRGKM